eukprot:scaffold201_cov405-Prasinococcus_capsulatus_cf.AAC.50
MARASETQVFGGRSRDSKFLPGDASGTVGSQRQVLIPCGYGHQATNAGFAVISGCGVYARYWEEGGVWSGRVYAHRAGGVRRLLRPLTRRGSLLFRLAAAKAAELARQMPTTPVSISPNTVRKGPGLHTSSSRTLRGILDPRCTWCTGPSACPRCPLSVNRGRSALRTGAAPFGTAASSGRGGAHKGTFEAGHDAAHRMAPCPIPSAPLASRYQARPRNGRGAATFTPSQVAHRRRGASGPAPEAAAAAPGTAAAPPSLSVSRPVQLMVVVMLMMLMPERMRYCCCWGAVEATCAGSRGSGGREGRG